MSNLLVARKMSNKAINPINIDDNKEDFMLNNHVSRNWRGKSIFCPLLTFTLFVLSVIANNSSNNVGGALRFMKTGAEKNSLAHKVLDELENEHGEFEGIDIVEEGYFPGGDEIDVQLEDVVSSKGWNTSNAVLENDTTSDNNTQTDGDFFQGRPVESLLTNTTEDANHIVEEDGNNLEHSGDLDIDHTIDSNFHTNSSDEQSMTLNYYANICRANRARNISKGTIEYEIAAADCGWKYDYLNSAGRRKKWKVYFYGDGFGNDIMDLSGCPTHCPLSPKCEMRRVKSSLDVIDGDVVVIFQIDAHSLVRKVKRTVNAAQKQYKVLYWREAQYRSPDEHIQKLFDFEMGVHYYSGLLNPSFLRKPSQLLSGALFPNPPFVFIPFAQRKGKFALSVISHCGAASQRENYISHMVEVLGAERVHKYGRCGDRKMPGKSINMAAKLMSQYKFYLAFENTVEDGYVTEKLFFALNVPVVPIYLGALNVPNVTVTHSFIKASDFKSPRELSQYLLHLDANEEEYMKYHSWRKSARSFTQEYLDSLANKVAGPEELLSYRSLFKRYPRTAQCCRLCDENYVKYAASTKSSKSLVGAILSGDAIQRRFFGKSGHF